MIDRSKPAPTPKQGDAAPARRKLVQSESSLNRKVWANSDGTRTAELFPNPVQVPTRSGWSDIDLSLRPRGDGSFGPTRPLVDATIPSTADRPVTVGSPVGSFSVRQVDAELSKSASASSDAVDFVGGLSGGRSIRIAPTPTGFEDTVSLPDATASPRHRMVFTVPVGVSAVQGPAGVVFVDTAGRTVATYGNGTAFTDSGPLAWLGGAPRSAPVSVALAGQAGSDVTVDIDVAPGFLSQVHPLQFPVHVDPYFSANSGDAGGGDTYVSSGQPTTGHGTSTDLKVGYVGSSEVFTRSLIQVPLPASSSNIRVLSANLNVNDTYATTCSASPLDVWANTGPWDPGSATWNVQPGHAGNPDWNNAPFAEKLFAHGASGCPAQAESLDITALAQRWMDGRTTNYGVMLTMQLEDGSQNYAFRFASAETSSKPVANGSGVKQGDTFGYDPYGGSAAVPDNSAGGVDNGWLGRHQRPLEHATGLTPLIEMGARPYLPSIGRFLQVDPVEGGSANMYDYVSGNPENALDISGTTQDSVATLHSGDQNALSRLANRICRRANLKKCQYFVTVNSVIDPSWTLLETRGKCAVVCWRKFERQVTVRLDVWKGAKFVGRSFRDVSLWIGKFYSSIGGGTEAISPRVGSSEERIRHGITS